MTIRQAFIQRINKAFAEGDIEFFLANVADDVRWTMVGSPPIQGKEAVSEAMRPQGMGTCQNLP